MCGKGFAIDPAPFSKCSFDVPAPSSNCNYYIDNIYFSDNTDCYL